MRFDVDKALAAHEQRRVRAKPEAALIAVDIERRLLGAILADVGVLERCDDVELDDFTDYRHRAVFVAIRALQSRGEIVGPCEVADEILLTDAAYERHVSEHAGIFFLAELVWTTWGFGGCEHTLAWTKRYLRILAQRRAAA